MNLPYLFSQQNLTKIRKRKHEEDKAEYIPSKIPRLEASNLHADDDFNKQYQSYAKFLDEFEQFLQTIDC